MARVKRIKVTDENFGDLVIASLDEAVAIQHGRASPSRLNVRERTARETRVAPPPTYGARRIQAVRKRLKVSQQVFAELLNVSSATVRAWERGARVPEGATLRLLELADRRPESLMASVSSG